MVSVPTLPMYAGEDTGQWYRSFYQVVEMSMQDLILERPHFTMLAGTFYTAFFNVNREAPNAISGSCQTPVPCLNSESHYRIPLLTESPTTEKIHQ